MTYPATYTTDKLGATLKHPPAVSEFASEAGRTVPWRNVMEWTSIPEPIVPDRIGAYRIESRLGRGGMGEVFLAWDARLERHVAIKRVRADKNRTDDPQDAYRRRFRREARAAAKLNHPAIVQIHDILESDDGDDLVMEYVAGEDLREALRDGALAPRRALTIARQIAEGLAEAHGKGFVHRDLKPENVRLTSDGKQAKILDFGLVRALWKDFAGETPDDLSTHTLTADGALVGTAYAMSPEQASGRSVDHRTDLFALGGLLYEMLAGRAPFRGENLLDTLCRINSEAPASLAALCPELPRSVVDLVEHLLEKEPDRRPQNATLVVHAIEDLLGEADVPATARRAARADAFEAASDDVTASGVRDITTAPAEAVVRVLVVTDLVDSTNIVDALGDERAADLFARHDRTARDLLARYDGTEIDKSGGFLLLFERPGDAVCFALAYHQALDRLSQSAGVSIASRIAVHLGEVFLRANSEQDVARGAKRLEVEGFAKPLAARVMGLAQARQTLLTRGAFDLARRAAVLGELADPQLRWLDHGDYSLKGVDEAVEICEVGLDGAAPLVAPPDSEKARRAVSFSDEITLGWRPATGQEVARRPKWILRERVGEGGFGEVWLAEHISGEHRVFKFCFEADRLRALKREVTLFRLLKEALGHRDDIARILDWNFDEAPFFLEAEYTEGGDLKTWAETQGGLEEVPLETRLEIAAQIADALAAAHSVGVLHKDVKPENVLIDAGPGKRPRVRLTDFGVGRLTDDSVLAGQAFTVTGLTEDASDSSAGTRLYMAPELLLRGPASVQADIYSLGVLTYQLAAGSFQNALATGWRRTIEDDLLCEDIAALVDGTPERRPASAAIVAERLRSLETRRAESEARRRDAESAEALRREHARILRRRKVLLSAAIGVAAIAVLVSIFAIQAEFARRDADAARGDAEQARSLAERRRAQAEDLIGFMVGDLREKLEPVGRLDVLEDVGGKALAYYAEIAEEEVDAATLGHRARSLRQIGDVYLQQGDLESAQEAFRGSAELLVRRIEVESTASLRAEFADTRFYFGYVSWERRDYEAALNAYLDHREIYAALAAEDPDNADWQLELAYGYMNVGDALNALARPREALEEHQKSLELLRELSVKAPSDLMLLTEVAVSHGRVGTTLKKLGDFEGALEQYRADLRISEGILQRDPENLQGRARLAVAHGFLDLTLRHLGNWPEAMRHAILAEELTTELTTYDPTNMEWRQSLTGAQLNRGWLLQHGGQNEEAVRLYRKALSVALEVVARSPENTAWTKLALDAHLWLGRLFLEAGDLEAALTQARSYLAMVEPADLAASQGYSLLGDVLQEQGDPVGAQVARGRALEAIEPLARDSFNHNLLRRHAESLIALERKDEAREIVERMAAAGPLSAELPPVFFQLAQSLPPQSSPESRPK